MIISGMKLRSSTAAAAEWNFAYFSTTATAAD
jgi:hypothetical protein